MPFLPQCLHPFRGCHFFLGNLMVWFQLLLVSAFKTAFLIMASSPSSLVPSGTHCSPRTLPSQQRGCRFCHRSLWNTEVRTWCWGQKPFYAAQNQVSIGSEASVWSKIAFGVRIIPCERQCKGKDGRGAFKDYLVHCKVDFLRSCEQIQLGTLLTNYCYTNIT